MSSTVAVNDDDDGLTDFELAFVEAYLGAGRMNVSRSARLAGYAENSFSRGYKLIAQAHIRKAIKKRMQARFRAWGIESERVLLELCAIAFSDIGKVASWNDEGIILEDSDTLPLAVRMSIKSVTQRATKYGPSIKVELYDKMKALDILARHLNLVDSNSGDDEGKVQFGLWADKQRALYSGEMERDELQAEIAELKQQARALKAKHVEVEIDPEKP
jgi:hypothetical protein